MNLQGRDFLKLLDYTPEEILYLIDLAAKLKEKKKKGVPRKMIIPEVNGSQWMYLEKCKHLNKNLIKKTQSKAQPSSSI